MDGESKKMNSENILKELFKDQDGSYAIAYSYTGRYMEWKIKNFVLRSFTEESKRHKNPLNILDIGCSNGDLVFNLSNIFPEYYFLGVDINPHLINYANERAIFRKESRIKFIVGDATNLDFDDKSFDIIISTETLEHLSDPKGAIKEMYRLLRDEGVAIISVPNGKNLFECALVKTLKKLISDTTVFKPKNEELQKHNGFTLEHVSLFVRKEWMRLFKEQSLKIERYRRGALFWGGNWIDAHRVLFAISILLDVAFDRLFIFNDVTENCLFVLRKKNSFYKK